MKPHTSYYTAAYNPSTGKGWSGPRGGKWAWWVRYQFGGTLGHEKTPTCARTVPGEGFIRTNRRDKATAWRRKHRQMLPAN